MVVNTIKKILPNFSGSYSKEFDNILKRFPPSYKLNNEDIKKLHHAYVYGENAHKNQKRSSGDRYFNHCIEVSMQLIDWDMDINTIIAGM